MIIEYSCVGIMLSNEQMENKEKQFRLFQIYPKISNTYAPLKT